MHFGTLTVDLGCFPFDYEAYPPQSDSRNQIYGIRSLRKFGNLVRPLAKSVLYRHKSPSEASPKAISGRTSYLPVRLAFHPYPHLIRQLFNVGRFGPPLSLTSASPWPWVDHRVSGLRQQTIRPVQTRFRFGSASLLNLAC